jgi:hypothetical protein
MSYRFVESYLFIVTEPSGFRVAVAERSITVPFGITTCCEEDAVAGGTVAGCITVVLSSVVVSSVVVSFDCAWAKPHPRVSGTARRIAAIFIRCLLNSIEATTAAPN